MYNETVGVAVFCELSWKKWGINKVYVHASGYSTLKCVKINFEPVFASNKYKYLTFLSSD